MSHLNRIKREDSTPSPRFDFIRQKEKDAYYEATTRKTDTRYFVSDKINTLDFETSLDLGCGRIDYPFRNVTRVDGNIDCNPEIIADLGQRNDFGEFDLVVSIEVAEHIEPELADNFVYNLTNNSRRWIVMTAATVQKEEDKSPYSKVSHLNEQPHEYWIRKIEACGFRYSDLTEGFKEYFSKCPRCPDWFKNDLMIYEKVDG